MKMTKYMENEGPHEALTPENAALLLIDHKVGLMQLVRDASPEEFRNNVLGLAKTDYNYPTIRLPVRFQSSQVYRRASTRPCAKGLWPD
jgi:hypothetical protein